MLSIPPTPKSIQWYKYMPLRPLPASIQATPTPSTLSSTHSVWVCFAQSPLSFSSHLTPIQFLSLSNCVVLEFKSQFSICLFEFHELELFKAEGKQEGCMMRGRWEGKCLPERQEELPINRHHTPSSCHVNREGLGYQTYWGGQNELMQLTSCFFPTCLPSVGRNWKSCLAKERECNLDYADQSMQTHERAVLLLPMPLFSFLHPSLPSFPLSFPISRRKGGV